MELLLTPCADPEGAEGPRSLSVLILQRLTGKDWMLQTTLAAGRMLMLHPPDICTQWLPVVSPQHCPPEH